ncbi:MAG: ABC transporter ATP-binding protein [Candidatus Woesearchaeota archaeon]
MSGFGEKQELTSSYILLKDISMTFKSRGDKIDALKNVNLEVFKDEFVSIVGPSGCGKTTLLKIVAGLIKPTSGQIFMAGKETTGPVYNIGMVFQSPVLLRWRTVLRNILLPIEVKKLDTNQYLDRAKQLIQLTGLSGFENKYPHELSGGMQQRVSICRALITDPDLLLMDEPFGALDALTREQLNIELVRIWQSQKKTVLFVTHSVSEAIYLSDKIVVMSARPGTIIECIEVDLPRPRKRTDPRFIELTGKILRLLGVKADV